MLLKYQKTSTQLKKKSRGPKQTFSKEDIQMTKIHMKICSVMSDSVRPHRRHPPGSPVPGILQARTLEWVAISFSNVWKWKVKVKLLSRVRLFTTWATRLLHPWDSPGKSTGVGCHRLLPHPPYFGAIVMYLILHKIKILHDIFFVLYCQYQFKFTHIFTLSVMFHSFLHFCISIWNHFSLWLKNIFWYWVFFY